MADQGRLPPLYKGGAAWHTPRNRKPRRPSPLLLELARIPLTHEQQQAVFAFAATMGNMNRRAGLVPAMGGALALPGDIEVLGIARQELQPLVDEFLENQKARGRAEGTLRSYRLALGRLVSICPLLPVTAAHVREAITRPARKDGPLLKQSTVRLRFALIGCFLAEMEEKGHLMSPCWEIGQVDGGDVEIRILSLDEMKMVYAAAMAGAPQRKHRELMERNGLMILFMMECGPRASDIAMMRARDVSDGWVRLRSKTKAQWVPVAREITDALKAQIRGDVVWPDQDGKPLQYQGGGLRGERRPGTGRHIGRAHGGPSHAALFRDELFAQGRRRFPAAADPAAPHADHDAAVRAARRRGRQAGPG